MKIALLGYGKMGKIVEEIALSQGHEIVCRFGRDDKKWEEIDKADICIDFSHPHQVFEHLKESALRHKNVVIGTTGWEERLKEVQAFANEKEIGILYAPNFSLGVHMFLKILEYASSLMNAYDDYEVAGIELHHSAKQDRPSGTALEIARRIKKHLERIDQLHFTSVRVGSIAGKHTVLFDSPFDTLTLCHEARNREGFAKGAILAAEWLYGKKGFYTLEDFINGGYHAS